MSSFSLLLFVAVCCLAGSANARYKKSATVCFDRDLKANVCGKVKFGPCGRPKSTVNANLKDCGKTNIEGNMFQVMETAGRMGEVLKLVGNRFKPLANCPPRPPCNNDVSTETLCDGVIRDQTRRPCLSVMKVPKGRFVYDPSAGGSDSGSGSGGYGSGSGGYGSGSGGYGCGGHGGYGSDGGSSSYDISSQEGGYNGAGAACGCKRRHRCRHGHGHGGHGHGGHGGGYGSSSSSDSGSDGGYGGHHGGHHGCHHHGGHHHGHHKIVKCHCKTRRY